MKELLDKIKINFKNNHKSVIILLLVWFVIIGVTLFYYKPSFGKESFGSETVKDVFNLNDKTSIEQRIKVIDGTESISVKYATFLRNNSGNVYISVVGEESGYEYLNEKTNIKTVQDNSYVTYKLNETIDVDKDEHIIISLSSDSKDGTCGGVYYTIDNFFEDGILKVNNIKNIGELSIKCLVNNDRYHVFCYTVIGIVSVVFTLIILAILLFDLNLEKIFLIMVIVFGLIFSLIMSPGGIPDECDHYELSLQVSNLMLFQKNNEIDKEYLNYDSFGSFINVAYSYNRFMRDFNKPLKLDNEIIKLQNQEKDLFEDTYIVYYVPQAVGVTLARLCNANMLKTFYAGRLSNLFFYAMCVYIALKNTPVHKMLFGIISILPIFIQQAASYSYDSFINGLSLISIAFLMRWLYGNETVSKKDIVIVFIVSLALAPAKIVYGFFSFLYWLVPQEKFGSRKQKLLICGLISIPALGYILINIWWRLEGFVSSIFESIKVSAETYVSNNFGPLKATDGGYDLNGGKTYTISYTLTHPIETINIILRTVRFWLSTWFYQSLGRALSGLTLILPMSYVRIVLPIIIITALRKEEYSMSPLVRTSFIVICLVESLFILLGMLYGWTLTTDYYIDGIQGRYFCPLLPYFFSVFNNKKITIPAKFDKYVLYTYLLLMFEVISYVLSYTFVNG